MSFLGLFGKKTLMQQSADKMKEAQVYVEQMSDRNTEWFNRTGRPAQERPGFAAETAALHAIHEEAIALQHQHNAAFRRSYSVKKAAVITRLTAEKAEIEKLRDRR